jgi:nucleoside-diphosphate-sugar epimerase
MKSALAGKSFDAVFDLAYDWDRGTTGEAVEGAARILNGSVGRYVFLSSVAAYGDGLNHHEGDALAADDHPDRYIRNKAQSERALFKLHHRHLTPVVTVRPPFVYGPGNTYYREQFFWDRMRDKRPVILPGDGRRLMQFVFVKDLVAALVKVSQAPPTVNGHAFNIANARPLTQAEVVDALCSCTGKPAEIVRVPRERLIRSGASPRSQQMYFGQEFDLPPITTIIAKAQRVLAFKPVPFMDGLKETYRWYLKNHRKPEQDYSLEELLLTRVKAQLAS